MTKTTIAAASFYKQGYSFNAEFNELPKDIKKDIRIICTCLAEKLHGVFVMGFYSDGSVYFEAFGEENDYNFDEIGAKLEINKLKTEEKDLIKALILWYAVFKTTQGNVSGKALSDREE